MRAAALLLYVTFACALAIEKRGLEVRSSLFARGIISNLPSRLKSMVTQRTVQPSRRFRHHLQRSDKTFSRKA
jgi:hypothetical protein